MGAYQTPVELIFQGVLRGLPTLDHAHISCDIRRPYGWIFVYAYLRGCVMASSKEYIDFVLDQCSGLSARAMMGEYVLYYGGKVVGGVYDNRLLCKAYALC